MFLHLFIWGWHYSLLQQHVFTRISFMYSSRVLNWAAVRRWWRPTQWFFFLLCASLGGLALGSVRYCIKSFLGLDPSLVILITHLTSTFLNMLLALLVSVLNPPQIFSWFSHLSSPFKKYQCSPAKHSAPAFFFRKISLSSNTAWQMWLAY